MSSSSGSASRRSDYGLILDDILALWTLTTLLALAGVSVTVIGRPDAEPRVTLEILPEDERRILEPVIETPGVTQVEVVARSGYSDAKVSQTLAALRERGLVYREPQGRTYRLYPGTLLGRSSSSDRAS